jgi:serine protease Do
MNPSDKQNEPNENGQNPSDYIYHWNYGEQFSFDKKKEKKKRRRGALIYALVMTVSLLLCLGVLVGTIALNQRAPAWNNQNGDLPTADVAELVSPTVVLIDVITATGSGHGTGFFIRSDGYILTNWHVIDGANRISVTTYTGRALEGHVKWSSEADDLALVKISGSNYPTASIGNSDALRVGETAIAIGHPSTSNCYWTVTQGIVSRLNREVSVQKNHAILDLVFLQTDAQVNAGNSGGPLCNARGEVIGIVTRKLSDYEGIGFAIPINGAMELVNAYLTTGTSDGVVSKVSKVRMSLGVQAATVKKGETITDDYNAPENGVLIVAVTKGGAAEGILAAGDILLSINGQRVETMEQLKDFLYTVKPGQKVLIELNRFGERLTLPLTFGSLN